MSTRVAVVVHHERSSAVEAALEAIAWLHSHGCRAYASADEPPTVRASASADLTADAVGELDLVLGIGGDGTMLRAADLVADSGTPILGVNAGQMGYLTEVERSDMLSTLLRWSHGEVKIEDRMRLKVTWSDGANDVWSLTALNEIVLEKAEAGHSVRLKASLDGEYFTSYVTDGLIVATPTGSTAYAFSARGPIVEATHRALLLTPVAPHQLFDRSLVLRGETEIGLALDGHRPGHLVLDGRLVARLEPGQNLSVIAAEVPSRFVRVGPSRFHEVLKRKFALSDR